MEQFLKEAVKVGVPRVVEQAGEVDVSMYEEVPVEEVVVVLGEALAGVVGVS